MALNFDGTNDKVDFGDIAAIDGATLSISVWYFCGATSQLGVLWAKQAVPGGSANDLSLHQSSSAGNTAGSRLTWLMGTSAPRITSDNDVFTINNWYHVAMTYNGGNAAADRAKLYLNGASIAATITGTLPTTITGTTAAVTLGTAADNTRDLTGRLGLLKVWDAELTAAEIAQEYNSYRPVKTSSPIQWSPLDDGTSAKDYSGQGNHGTITDATQISGPPVSVGG